MDLYVCGLTIITHSWIPLQQNNPQHCTGHAFPKKPSFKKVIKGMLMTEQLKGKAK